MIPEAAVEAAARGMCGTHPLAQWEHQPKTERDMLMEKARQALEAAAPYMCAHLADSDLILEILESAGVEKANQFDALVAAQKLTAWEAQSDPGRGG